MIWILFLYLSSDVQHVIQFGTKEHCESFLTNINERWNGTRANGSYMSKYSFCSPSGFTTETK